MKNGEDYLAGSKNLIKRGIIVVFLDPVNLNTLVMLKCPSYYNRGIQFVFIEVYLFEYSFLNGFHTLAENKSKIIMR